MPQDFDNDLMRSNDASHADHLQNTPQREVRNLRQSNVTSKPAVLQSGPGKEEEGHIPTDPKERQAYFRANPDAMKAELAKLQDGHEVVQYTIADLIKYRESVDADVKEELQVLMGYRKPSRATRILNWLGVDRSYYKNKKNWKNLQAKHEKTKNDPNAKQVALNALGAKIGLTPEQVAQQYEKVQMLKDITLVNERNQHEQEQREKKAKDPNHEIEPFDEMTSSVAPIMRNNFDHIGSQAHLKFSRIVGDHFGLHPAFAALLFPTGGIVGPGDANGIYTVLKRGGENNEVLGEHGITHDAGGFMYNALGIGPGYNYSPVLDEPGIETSNKYAGQISGIITQMALSNLMKTSAAKDGNSSERDYSHITKEALAKEIQRIWDSKTWVQVGTFAYEKGFGKLDLTIKDDVDVENKKLEYGYQKLIRSVKGVVRKIGGKVKQAYNYGKAKAKQAGRWVKRKAKQAGGWVGDKAKQAGSWVKKKSKQAGNWVKKKTKQAGNWMKKTGKKIGRFFRKWF